MSESDTLTPFDELPSSEQHTVPTYLDEVLARDTVTGAEPSEPSAPSGFDGLLHAIPSADLDRGTAQRLMQSVD